MNSPLVTGIIRRSPIATEPSRARQTVQPTSPFRQALATSANLLLSGAEAATIAAGVPHLSAAISRVRVNTQSQSVTATLPATSTVSTTVPDAVNLGVPPDMAAIQDQRYANDMQLLEMQASIQAHSNHVTLVSNVMKAKHETEKAAISNIRA